MKRRGFLAGILAAGVAPAIVHNPMKIFVPKQEIQRAGLGLIESMTIRHGWKDLDVNSSYARLETVFGEAFFPTAVIQPEDIGFAFDARPMSADFAHAVVKQNQATMERQLQLKKLLATRKPGETLTSFARSLHTEDSRSWLT